MKDSPTTPEPTLERIVTIPLLEEVEILASDCLQLGCLGAVTGPSGIGKTVALRSVERKLSRPGSNCFYFRAYQTEGHTRCVRDFLHAIGIRSSTIPSGLTLQVLIKLALREIRAREIKLLLVDEADHWPLDGLKGFIAMVDAAHSDDYGLSAILCGNTELATWLAHYAPGMSRTLRCCHGKPLSAALSLATLRQWSPVFDELAIRINSGDKTARRTASLIHAGTGGSLRRLNYFARLYVLRHGTAEVDEERVSTVLRDLITE